MKLIESLDSAYSIQKGDVITHPTFERLKVDFITRESDKDDYTMLCRLLDFNDTLKEFKGLDLVRIKFKRRTAMRIVRDD